LGEAFFFGYFSMMGYCWNSSFPLRNLGIFKDLPNMGFDKKTIVIICSGIFGIGLGPRKL
jgi:hypothetical protein